MRGGRRRCQRVICKLARESTGTIYQYSRTKGVHPSTMTECGDTPTHLPDFPNGVSGRSTLPLSGLSQVDLLTI